MRLKEIKPGMVVHCKTKEEMEELAKHKKFYVSVNHIWNYGNDGFRRDCIAFDDECRYCGFDIYNYFSSLGKKITEFSDLILPELTAEEVVEWLAKNYEDETYREVFGRDYLMSNLLEDMTPSEVVEKIAHWKDDHEKKEPEIETVDICRIIEIQPDGRKRCVHEEDIVSDLPFGGNECQIVEEILKRYCMEHEGEFIAVCEIVSRVKK